MSGLFSTWLLPEAAEERALQAIIDEQAAAFGQAPFAAHLTLTEEVGMSLPEMERHVEAASEGIGRFDAVVEAVEAGDLHFRCLFARFAPCPPLSALRARLAAALGLDPQAAFMPHVSLLYGVPGSPRKRDVQARLASSLTGCRIGFDRVCVVASAKEIPIERWAVRRTVRLPG